MSTARRGLDFYPLEYASLAEDVPTIVVSHGLSGGLTVYFNNICTTLTQVSQGAMSLIFARFSFGHALLSKREAWATGQWSLQFEVVSGWLLAVS